MPVKSFHISNSTKAYSLSITTDLDLEKVKFSLVMYENLTIGCFWGVKQDVWRSNT